MFSIADLAITSVDTVTAFDITTGAYLWQLDELQNISIAQGEEKTDITGKQGRKITSLKRNKTLTLSGANGLLSHGLLESQTGGEFVSATPVQVNWSESLVVNTGAASTSYVAVGTAGAEIKSLQIKNADGTLGAFLDQDASAATGKFAYNPSTKALSFHTDVPDNTEVFVTYNRMVSADRLFDYSDKYSGKAHIFVDAMAENKCGNLYHVQIEIPKGDFNGQVTWDMGDNQAVHNFEIEALSGGCGNASKGSTLFIYTVFGANAADTKSLKSIAITTPPTDVSYTAGETFDPTGMVVKATYSDDTQATLNAGSYTYSPNGALATTDTEVIVSYTESGITKIVAQAITVAGG